MCLCVCLSVCLSGHVCVCCYCYCKAFWTAPTLSDTNHLYDYYYYCRWWWWCEMRWCSGRNTGELVEKMQLVPPFCTITFPPPAPHSPPIHPLSPLISFKGKGRVSCPSDKMKFRGPALYRHSHVYYPVKRNKMFWKKFVDPHLPTNPSIRT